MSNARAGLRIASHYLILLGVAFFCHGILLINEATIWDSWYVLAWLKAQNFAPMQEFFGAVGMPSYSLIYQQFARFDHITATFMVATFGCVVAGGILTYHLALRLAPLSRGEALGIAALTLAMPVFNAAQDFIMFFFIFAHTLFLASALCVVRGLERNDWHRRVWVAAGIFGLWLSFANAALLAFYGAFYVALFFRFGRSHEDSLVAAGWRFIWQHPLLFLLPPISWIGRGWLTPQYGWYAHYNSPWENIGQLGPNLWSFFQHVPGFHLRRSVYWGIEHPIGVAVLVTIVIGWWLGAPKRWGFQPGPVATRHLFAFGCISLFLAVFPFAAAGKTFAASPVGQDSHHFFLVGLPASLLLYAALRGLANWRKRTDFGHFTTPVIGCCSIFFGAQLFDFYVAEQAEWIFNRSLLHNAVRNEVARTSSILGLQGFPFAKQVAYSTYGFASAFGDLTRLASPIPPENRRFYTPSEIQHLLLQTTVLPSEFKRIDPSGQQALLVGKLNRESVKDWSIVRRYHMIRWLGSAGEMDAFLASLSSVSAAVLKPAVPLPTSANPVSNADKPNSGAVPDSDFANSIGMRMVKLPWGWWAGKFEVTQREYERIMLRNPSLFKDPWRPVESVTWDEADEFCRRLTEREAQGGTLPAGYVYRLPSVQEFNLLIAEIHLRETVTAAGETRWHTLPAGSFPPNSLGLHDIVGNVWEWSLDWGDKEHRFKLSCGGSWANQPWELAPFPGRTAGLGSYQRAAIERLFGPLRRDYPSQAFWDRGFRCVLAPSAKATTIRQADAPKVQSAK